MNVISKNESLCGLFRIFVPHLHYWILMLRSRGALGSDARLPVSNKDTNKLLHRYAKKTTFETAFVPKLINNIKKLEKIKQVFVWNVQWNFG